MSNIDEKWNIISRLANMSNTNNHSLLCELMMFYEKTNLAEITPEEAQQFWETMSKRRKENDSYRIYYFK